MISNTIVHHIPDPGPALAEMARLVAPGGTLMVRDLYRPDDIETLDRLVATYAGAESPSARGLFEASLHAALTLDGDSRPRAGSRTPRRGGDDDLRPALDLGLEPAAVTGRPGTRVRSDAGFGTFPPTD